MKPKDNICEQAVAKWRLKHRVQSIIGSAILPVFMVACISLVLGLDSTSYVKTHEAMSWLDRLDAVISAALSILGIM